MDRVSCCLIYRHPPVRTR
ncbi:hypothetical protein G3O06_36720 [Burkholderia sp. Ac-20345]|nr:hypothetical protein [Burkholderia sp. Ac-20345]